MAVSSDFADIMTALGIECIIKCVSPANMGGWLSINNILGESFM
jgi:hypothetical protein